MTNIDPIVDTHLAQGLRARAADLGDEDQFYEQVLATIAILPQRRWFLRWPATFSRRTSLLLVAAAALVGMLVGGALLAGSGIVKLPSVPPSVVPPTAPTSTSPSAELPSATPTALPAPAGLVAYRNYVPRKSRHGCTPGNITWFGSGQPPISAIGYGSRMPTEQARTSCFRMSGSTRLPSRGRPTEPGCSSKPPSVPT